MDSELGGDETSRDEAKRWLIFARTFQEGDDRHGRLQSLDAHLLKRSVVIGAGTAISPVDIAVFLAVRDTVVDDVIPTRQDGYQNVMRWFDYIQDEEKVASFFQKVFIKKSMFEPQDFSDVSAKKPLKTDPEAATAGSVPSSKLVATMKENNELPDKVKEAVKAVANAKERNIDSSHKAKDRKGKEDNTSSQKKEDKKGKEEAEASVSALDIRVGLVVKVWKHPSADSLLVEEIDLGEVGIRQVVSGLAKYLNEQELLNRKVVMIANVKPGKLRDVVSAGLVLCASNSDHSVVEPLVAPDAAAVGERITFAGHEGKAEEVLNPKKKQLEKIFPDLFTDDSCVATYQGIPFMTSGGPCKSSLAKAAIK